MSDRSDPDGTATYGAADTVDVLREHVQFLREMIAEKNSWLQQSLKEAESRLATHVVNYEKMREERDQLKIHLAEACLEARTANNHDNHTIDPANITMWEKALGYE